MFLINTRKRNPDNTFGHEKMPKGDFDVYEISKASDGEDAQQKTLAARTRCSLSMGSTMI